MFYKTSEGPLPPDNYYPNFIGLGADNSLLAPKFNKYLLSPITFPQTAISNAETINVL